jgi:hypothetical protein
MRGQIDRNLEERGARCPRRPNAPRAKLQRQGPRAGAARRAACHVRAAISGARGLSGGVPPSDLSVREGLQPRTEAGRCQLQREVSPRIREEQTTALLMVSTTAPQDTSSVG